MTKHTLNHLLFIIVSAALKSECPLCKYDLSIIKTMLCSLYVIIII